MNSEEKIRELTERIEKLEKAERKRVIKKRIDTIAEIIKALIIIAIIIMLYIQIKPYKEKIDDVNEKINSVEEYINDKFGGLSKYLK